MAEHQRALAGVIERAAAPGAGRGAAGRLRARGRRPGPRLPGAGRGCGPGWRSGSSATGCPTRCCTPSCRRRRWPGRRRPRPLAQLRDAASPLRDPHRHLAVPLRWFVPFAPGATSRRRGPAGRAGAGATGPRMSAGPAPGGPGAAHAARRTGRAGRSPRARGAGPLAGGVPPALLVELDYGGLARCCPDDDRPARRRLRGGCGRARSGRAASRRRGGRGGGLPPGGGPLARGRRPSSTPTRAPDGFRQASNSGHPDDRGLVRSRSCRRWPEMTISDIPLNVHYCRRDPRPRRFRPTEADGRATR